MRTARRSWRISGLGRGPWPFELRNAVRDVGDPVDNYIRLMLDGATPGAFEGLFFKAIEAAGR